MPQFLLTLLIIISSVQHHGANEVLEGCDYDNIQRMYFCNDITYTFPNQYYGDYHLRCVECNITKFTENTFPYTNSLESFNVSYSGIRGIHRKAFSKFTSTQFLYLDHNDIRDIAENTFAGAKQLYELHLEYNHLKRLKPRFVNELGANSIDLSHNQLVEIGDDVFEGVIGVLYLDMSFNKIAKLTERSFESLDSLEILDLKENKICHIPLGVFGKLPSLKTLNLSHNKLSSFTLGSFSVLHHGANEILEGCDYDNSQRMYFCNDITYAFPNQYYGDYHLRCVECNITKFTENTFPYTNSLESFNVSYSGIRGIHRKAFSKFTSTQFLYLDHNDIRDIAENTFAGAKQLYELHLEYNHLKRLKPRFVNELGANSIDLSHNQLVEIGDDVFEGVIGVLYLDMSFNKIAKLTERSFESLDSLEILDLKENQICHIPLGVFGKLPSLKTLNLSHNKLSSFTLGSFSGLKSLVELNLANNSLQHFDGHFLLTLPGIHWVDISENGIYYFDEYSIAENAPSLKQLKMDHNIFSCSSLKNFVRHLRKANIEIISDSESYDVQNILGIACSEKEITRVSYKKFYAAVREEAKNIKHNC